MKLKRRQILQFSLAAAAGVGLAGAGLAFPRIPLTRPPRTLPGQDFESRCMRCGACVQACPTSALSQRDLSLDFRATGVPFISARKGGCTAWNDGCRKCAEACPSGAIDASIPLQGQKLAVAKFTPSECTNCMVCLRRCPIPEAVYFPNPDGGKPWYRDDEAKIPYAIKTPNSRIKPVINEELCVGCGLCVAHCIPKVMHLEPAAV